MYNEERKMCWLENSVDGSEAFRTNAISFLDRLGECVEEQLDRDLFELVERGDKALVIDALQEHGRFFSYLILRRFCTYVNSYLAWCYATLRSSTVPSGMKFTAYEISLVQAFASFFIRTQDELESAMLDAPYQEGFILPVCCSLAWMGYSVKEMCALSEQNVKTENKRAFVCGVPAPSGFVNDSIAYYASNNAFFRGKQSVPYVKGSGNAFLRQTFPEDGAYSNSKDMIARVRNIASRYTIRKTGATVSFRQLTTAGEFHRILALENAGYVIDAAAIGNLFGTKGQSALDRLREYEQFKIALSL